jgi:proline iminopeptidase
VIVTVNNDLNVEVLGPAGAPVLIARHGGGGIGSLAEPRATFGPLADRLRVVVFDARGCGLSEGRPPFSHAQWAADVDGLREWLGAEQVMVAGGSYGGFIAMEYAVAYPGKVRAMILRDTSADNSNLARAYENARRQDRIEINWDKFRPVLVGPDLRRRGSQGPVGGHHPAVRLRVRPGPGGRAGRGGHLPARVSQLVLPAQHAGL